MDFDSFCEMSSSEIAALVQASGALVCVFTVNGTRRWFFQEKIAKQEYCDSTNMREIIAQHIITFRMLFEHGIDTLLLPILGNDLMGRESINAPMAVQGICDLTTDPQFMDFCKADNIRVRLYGDYRKQLGDGPQAHSLLEWERLVRLTESNGPRRIFFGLFVDNATELIAELAIEFFRREGRAPDSHEMVTLYFGEYIDPVKIFIGFGKYSSFGMPMISTGNEDLYFPVIPSLYLTKRGLRAILYDHLYTRQAIEPEYTDLSSAAMDRMRAFYIANQEQVNGIGVLVDGIWYPQPTSTWPENFAHLSASTLHPVEGEHHTSKSRPLPVINDSSQELYAPIRKEEMRPQTKSFEDRIQKLLSGMNRGNIRPTAYDTAWVARLLEMDRPLGSQAMQWLCENQLPDGSWGSEEPVYYQDRVISTLAAMTALCRFGKRAEDRSQIQRGQVALDTLVKVASRGLAANSFVDSVGFELIVPTLITEAESLGLIQNQSQQILGHLAKHREEKLRFLAGKHIDHTFSTAFSAEMAGTDHIDLLDIANLPELNGSIGCSPSATAYYALTLRPEDPCALSYLHSVMEDGGVPHIVPYNILERLWVLWNISLAYSPDSNSQKWFTPHLDFLEKVWREHQGLGYSSEYTLTDPDDTAMAVDIFLRYGRGANVTDLLAFQTDSYFRSYQYESGSSSSVNVHVLGALRQAGYPGNHPAVRGVLDFLEKEQKENSYWMDKWHLSPFYPTSHAVINCSGWIPESATLAVEWLKNTQRPDGSWGWQMPTAEETAYALQALCVWRQSGNSVDDEIFARGLAWLKPRSAPPYPPLWIAKCLYCPQFVVESAILSAEMLAGSV